MEPTYDPNKTNLIEFFFEQSHALVIDDDRKLRRLILAHMKALDEDEVAALIGVSRRTLTRWIKSGKWRMPSDGEGNRRMTPQAFQREFDRVFNYGKN